MKQFFESVLLDPACELPQPLRSKLIELVRESDPVIALKQYFGDDPIAAVSFRSSCRDHASRFVEAEMARLKEAKRTGSLTEDDVAFARNELQSLLDSIEQLCVEGIQRVLTETGSPTNAEIAGDE